MPLLTEVRDAAVALLKEGLPEAARVEAFVGDLNVDSVAGKHVLPSGQGSVFVTFGEAENLFGDHDLDLNISAAYGCFVLARDVARPAQAEAVALAMAQKVAILLNGATYGLYTVSPARIMSIAPVTDEGMAQKGIHAWAVTWNHFVEMES